MSTVEGLRRAATCVFIAMDREPAADVSARLKWAAAEIEQLRAIRDGCEKILQERNAEIKRLRAAARLFLNEQTEENASALAAALGDEQSSANAGQQLDADK